MVDLRSKAIEVIRMADQLLTEYGWCRGEYVNLQGQRCAVGALRSARSTLSLGHGILTEEGLAYTDGYQLAIDTMQKLTDRWTPLQQTIDVIAWNDTLGRTEEDVHLIFKRTIEVLESTDG